MREVSPSAVCWHDGRVDQADPREAVSAHYDDRAPTYDESPMHRSLADEVAARAISLAPRRLLDVGTGTGLVLRAAHRLDPALRLIGLDRSPGMLALARTALPDAVLVRADAADVPLPDASVDAVTCVTVLHLLPDPIAAMAEWRRVLRPRGRVLTATFAAPAPAGVGPRPDPGFPRRHEAFRTADLLDEVAASADLQVVASEVTAFGDDRLLLAELAPVQDAA